MEDRPVELRKILGRRDVLALAFGAMIGWSWVVLAGEILGEAGSAGTALAFGLGAVMVLLVGFAYAELTSALSRAGGELTFTYVGIGPRAAFVCGWTLILAYIAVCAFEAVAITTVVGYLFEGFGAVRLYSIAGWDVMLSLSLVGSAGALVVGLVNLLGIRPASFLQSLAAILLFAIGLAFFIPGSLLGDPANLAPLFTSVDGFFRVVLMTPFLYLGFDVIPQVAEEIALPFRAVGKVLILSIVLALGWYVLVFWTVGMTFDAETLAAQKLPTADAMAAVYRSPWGAKVMVFGGLLGILTSWNAFFIGATRLLFAMARGGMLPGVFARLHPRFGSPTAAIALVTAISVAAPFFGRPALVWLVNAGSLATVIAYLLVAVSFLAIRRRHPDLARPYRAPWPRVVGALAVLVTVLFVVLYLPGTPASLRAPEWGIVLVWAAVGVVFVAVRRGAAGMDEAERRRRILGEYAERL